MAVLLIPIKTYARSDTITVTLNKCIDGDTVIFNYKKEEMKVRFLAVDTRELKSKDKYATIAKDFTCDTLKNAKKIEIKFDKGSDELDKYGRYLAWIFADSTLIQKELIKKGYAEVKYIYGTYEYTDELKDIEKQAKKDKLGIWKDYKEEKKKIDYYQLIYAAILILCIILGVSTKKTNKIKKIMKSLKK